MNYFEANTSTVKNILLHTFATGIQSVLSSHYRSAQARVKRGEEHAVMTQTFITRLQVCEQSVSWWVVKTQGQFRRHHSAKDLKEKQFSLKKPQM